MQQQPPHRDGTPLLDAAVPSPTLLHASDGDVLILKCQLKDVPGIRRITVDPLTTAFEDLASRIARNFRLDPAALLLHYVDADGDCIVLQCHNDLQELLRATQTCRNVAVAIEVSAAGGSAVPTLPAAPSGSSISSVSVSTRAVFDAAGHSSSRNVDVSHERGAAPLSRCRN